MKCRKVGSWKRFLTGMLAAMVCLLLLENLWKEEAEEDGGERVEDFIQDAGDWPMDSDEAMTIVTAFFNLGTIVKGLSEGPRPASAYFRWLPPWRLVKSVSESRFTSIRPLH